jgi:hypothetical protein
MKNTSVLMMDSSLNRGVFFAKKHVVKTDTRGVRSPTSGIVLRVRTTTFRLEVGLLRKSWRLANGIVDGNEFCAVGKGRFDLNFVDHLGDAVHDPIAA